MSYKIDRPPGPAPAVRIERPAPPAEPKETSSSAAASQHAGSTFEPASVRSPSMPSLGGGGLINARGGSAQQVGGPSGAGASELATRQALAAYAASAEYGRIGGRVLTDNNSAFGDSEVTKYRQGIGGGNWCGMFAGWALKQAGFKDSLRPELASTYKALRFFTQPGSDRQLFLLDGTDTAGAQWQGVGRLPEDRYTYQNLPIRPGDVVIFDDGFQGGTGHIGLVESYDPATGTLVTIEGNVDGGQIQRRTYDLTDPAVRDQLDGFGRPALADFESPEIPAG